AITDPRYLEPATQLCGSAGSIGANLCEGYARLSPGDRIRFYEYALGSAAETKNWYLKIRRTLPDVILAERFALLHSITRLTLAMIRSERAKLPPKSTSPRRRS
ncbi:MAG TPA: four helix bundle protein, partial [Gemmatimonadaceae bacterium]|nr:four helix bundle protein [Gemmatimonadaceae bacterium]